MLYQFTWKRHLWCFQCVVYFCNYSYLMKKYMKITILIVHVGKSWISCSIWYLGRYFIWKRLIDCFIKISKEHSRYIHPTTYLLVILRNVSEEDPLLACDQLSWQRRHLIILKYTAWLLFRIAYPNSIPCTMGFTIQKLLMNILLRT